MVLILLGIVEAALSTDSEYQDLDSQLFDLNSLTDDDHLLQESETGHHHLTNDNLDSDEENLQNQDGIESTNQGEETLTNDDKPDHKKQKSHWWSRHNKDSDSSSSEEGEAKFKLARKKVAKKVNGILRQQVLRKASEYTGEVVDDSDGHPLVKKVTGLARDAAIRRLTPLVIRKTLNSGVNYIKSKVDNIDDQQGTVTTRDVDLFNERLLARDLGFRIASRVVDTIGMMAGGAVAEGTVRKLHKPPKDEVVAAVEGLGEEHLTQLAQEINEDKNQDKLSNHKKLKHGKENDHDKDKHKHDKQKKDKHHKKGKGGKENEHEEEEKHKKNKAKHDKQHIENKNHKGTSNESSDSDESV